MLKKKFVLFPRTQKTNAINLHVCMPVNVEEFTLFFGFFLFFICFSFVAVICNVRCYICISMCTYKRLLSNVI